MAENIAYVLDGNKFIDVADFNKAQQLLDLQLDTIWVEILSGFIPTVFPMMKDIVGKGMSYTWTLWQREG